MLGMHGKAHNAAKTKQKKPSLGEVPISTPLSDWSKIRVVVPSHSHACDPILSWQHGAQLDENQGLQMIRLVSFKSVIRRYASLS